MQYDFTSILDRRGKDAIAVDAPERDDCFGADYFSKAKLKPGFDRIPMWVADMNFPTVPTIRRPSSRGRSIRHMDISLPGMSTTVRSSVAGDEERSYRSEEREYRLREWCSGRSGERAECALLERRFRITPFSHLHRIYRGAFQQWL